MAEYDWILIYLLHTTHAVGIHKTKGSFVSENDQKRVYQKRVQIELDFQGEDVIRLL